MPAAFAGESKLSIRGYLLDLQCMVNTGIVHISPESRDLLLELFDFSLIKLSLVKLGTQFIVLFPELISDLP